MQQKQWLHRGCVIVQMAATVKLSYNKQPLSHHGFDNREATASSLAAIFLCNNSMQSYVVVIAKPRCEASNRLRCRSQ